jgi:hypothetical protein
MCVFTVVELALCPDIIALIALVLLPLLPKHWASSQLKRKTSFSARAEAGGLCLCPPTYASGFLMEEKEKDLLPRAHQSTAASTPTRS